MVAVLLRVKLLNREVVPPTIGDESTPVDKGRVVDVDSSCVIVDLCHQDMCNDFVLKQYSVYIQKSPSRISVVLMAVKILFVKLLRV